MKVKLNRVGRSGMLALVLTAACGSKGLLEVGTVPGHAAGASPADGGSSGNGSTGGSAGSAGAPSFDCNDCEIVAAAPATRAIVTRGEQVYWIDYGNLDELGNYQDDGRLLMLDGPDAEPEVLADGLPGPMQLSIAGDNAYVALDQSTAVTGRGQLARVALASGDVTLLQPLADALSTQRWITDPLLRARVASGGGYVFWVNDRVLYRLAETSAGPPEVVLRADKWVYVLADESQLYVYDSHGIGTMAFAADSPTLLKAITDDEGPDYSDITLAGDYLYAREWAEAPYITRLSKLGGNWKRLGMLYGERWWADGSSYVVATQDGDGSTPSNEALLLSGSWGNTSERTVLASKLIENEPYPFWGPWEATPSYLYLADHGQLYRVRR